MSLGDVAERAGIGEKIVDDLRGEFLGRVEGEDGHPNIYYIICLVL